MTAAAKVDPALACRGLATFIAEWDASGSKKLVAVAARRLPKKTTGPALEAHLRPAIARVSSKALQNALKKLFANCGLSTDDLFESPPKTVDEIDHVLEVPTDGAVLGLLDGAVYSLEEHGDDGLLDAVNSGRIAFWHTGSDGFFRVRFTGADPTEGEKARARGSETFGVDVRSGELTLTGGVESRSLAVPKGKLLATITAIDTDDDDSLPQYVVVFEKPRKRTLASHEELPLIE